MGAPAAAELLAAWEQGQDLSPARRCVLLLRAADPALDLGCGQRLSVGHSDRRLLDLRERLFGARLTAVSKCPRCGEALDLAFDTADLRAETLAGDQPTHRLEFAGYRLTFRLPTPIDLEAVALESDENAARNRLLERCLSEVSSVAGPVAVGALPQAVVGALGDAMRKADPLASTRLELTCPSCAHQWSGVFDIGAYLWRELGAWARGILMEVHVLARAYGWTETEILALSPARRRHYLDLVST